MSTYQSLLGEEGERLLLNKYAQYCGNWNNIMDDEEIKQFGKTKKQLQNVRYKASKRAKKQVYDSDDETYLTQTKMNGFIIEKEKDEISDEEESIIFEELQNSQEITEDDSENTLNQEHFDSKKRILYDFIEKQEYEQSRKKQKLEMVNVNSEILSILENISKLSTKINSDSEIEYIKRKVDFLCNENQKINQKLDFLISIFKSE